MYYNHLQMFIFWVWYAVSVLKWDSSQHSFLEVEIYSTFLFSLGQISSYFLVWCKKFVFTTMGFRTWKHSAWKAEHPIHEIGLGKQCIIDTVYTKYCIARRLILRCWWSSQTHVKENWKRRLDFSFQPIKSVSIFSMETRRFNLTLKNNYFLVLFQSSLLLRQVK